MPPQKLCDDEPEGASGTVLVSEGRLSHFPVAVALAVMTSPVANTRPVLVQALVATVVVPSEVVPALNNSITAPSASELVPVTVDVPVSVPLVMEVIVGVEVCSWKVTTMLSLDEHTPLVTVQVNVYTPNEGTETVAAGLCESVLLNETPEDGLEVQVPVPTEAAVAPST